MSKKPQIQNEELPGKEIARRRDAALMRALNTPHKRQSEMKIGKPSLKSDVGASPKKRGRQPKPTK